MLRDTRATYGLMSIGLHWLAAALIIYLYLDGSGLDEATDPAQRATHIALGAGASILLLARVAWRLMSVAPSPLTAAPVLNWVATAVKVALLIDIVLAVLTGFLTVWYDGQAVSVLGLFSIPSPFAAAHQTAQQFKGLHSLTTHLFLPIIGLHVLGTLKHLFWDRDGTLARMLWVKRGV